MKRLLCAALVAACIVCLCACAASNPTGAQLGSNTTTTVQPGIDPTVQPGTDPTVPTVQPTSPTPTAPVVTANFDLSLMPEARKEEILRSWGNCNMNCDLDWEAEHNFQTRFCGDFGTYVVIWGSTGWETERTVEVAGYTFTFSSTFELWVCYNGGIYAIEDPYVNWLIEEKQIGLLHAFFESNKAAWAQAVATKPLEPVPPFTQPERPPYPFEGSFDPDALLADIPADVQLQIKQALADQFDPTHEHIRVERVALEVFGIFEDVYALRSVGVFFGTDALESETINGLRFTYSNSAAVLFIYYDGHWYRLQEAFDAQIIGEEELLVIYENYYKAFPYIWGY